jgi:hypothetical protein
VGAAKITAYDCPSSGFNGTIVSRQTVTNNNITQTIIANVTTPGTYNLTTYSNETNLTFSGSGSLSGTGSQTIVLTASNRAIPDKGGIFKATLQNVSPGCDFSVPITSETSGGTAVIDWTSASVPAAYQSEDNRNFINGVETSTYSPSYKYHLTVNVTQIGTYNFDAYSNRYPGAGQTTPLHLVGSGTFTSTGLQVITLLFYGASTSGGGTDGFINHYFTLRPAGTNPIVNTFQVIKNGYGL